MTDPQSQHASAPRPSMTPITPVTLQPQMSAIDFRVLHTFDAVIVHHRQTALIDELKQAEQGGETLVYELDTDLLLSRMIASPVLVVLNEQSIALIEAHLQTCVTASQSHGLYTLLDYASPRDRAKQTRASGQTFLPNTESWQRLATSPTDSSSHAHPSVQPPNFARIAQTLANHQIIGMGMHRKHFRYLDPQVMIHLIALHHMADIAKRHAYAKRMWIALGEEWYDLEGIHQYTPHQLSHLQRASSYCPLTHTQLDTISTINCFFAKEGIEGSHLILRRYPTLLAWVEQATQALNQMPNLTNPVDRTLVMNRWLSEYYEQSGLATHTTPKADTESTIY